MRIEGYLDLSIGFEADGTDEAYEDFLDRVLEELDKLGEMGDYTASLTDRTATFHLRLEDAQWATVEKKQVALRTALHAADAHTGLWPESPGKPDEWPPGAIFGGVAFDRDEKLQVA